MSEFKYACPVCGQHIKCDSSQAGTVMDCPTCFQKITVPQAPTGEDQKLILTGTKVSERPVSARNFEPVARPASKFPGATAVLLILLFMGTVAAAVYWTTIIHPRHTSSGPAPATNVISVISANDANWTLTLHTNAISDAPAAGRVHGQDFTAQHVTLQNGVFGLRGNPHGSDFGVWVNFGGVPAESLAGKRINVTTNADKAAKVTLRWLDADGVSKQNESFENGYAMRLEFGELANNRIAGKIYLCLPDEQKSYVMGSFNADVRKPKPKELPKP